VTFGALIVVPAVLWSVSMPAQGGTEAASRPSSADSPLAASLGQDDAPVTLEQAVMTAVAAIPGRAVEAQLSADEGRVVYEVEIIDRAQDRRRVYVDAEGGKIIKVRATAFQRK
jgi:uncharacterized membrane protein YkoI